MTSQSMTFQLEHLIRRLHHPAIWWQNRFVLISYFVWCLFPVTASSVILFLTTVYFCQKNKTAENKISFILRSRERYNWSYNSDKSITLVMKCKLYLACKKLYNIKFKDFVYSKPFKCIKQLLNLMIKIYNGFY